MNPDPVAEFERIALSSQRSFTESFRQKTEVRLSKSDSARLSRAEMKGFLAALEGWANGMKADGYEIRSEPEPGLGTMVWKAVKK